MLLAKGETERARALLMEAIRYDPDSLPARLLIGVTQCRLGEFEDAMYVLQRLVEEYPANADAHVLLGTAYFGLGRKASSLKEMERALQADPENREAHFNLTQIYLVASPPDFEAARAHYRRAIGLGCPRDADTELLLED
jgi:tetratricopeptide (TPR) repeat protein